MVLRGTKEAFSQTPIDHRPVEATHVEPTQNSVEQSWCIMYGKRSASSQLNTRKQRTEAVCPDVHILSLAVSRASS